MSTEPVRLPAVSGRVQASTAPRIILTGLGVVQNLGKSYTVRVEPPTKTDWVLFNENAFQGERCVFISGSFRLHGEVRPARLPAVPQPFSQEVTRCKDRLASFQKFRDGWYNGDGIAPSTVAIATANFLLDQKTQLASVISIFPAIEGGVLFEFKLRRWDYSIEISNKGELEFLGVELDGPGELGPRTFTGQKAIEKVLEQLRKVGM